MKMKFTLSLVAVSLSAMLFAQANIESGQAPALPAGIHQPFSFKAFNNQSKLHPSKTIHNKKQDIAKGATTDVERCILITHISGTTTLDSLHFIYSQQRGSYTAPEDFIYYSYLNSDSAYYYANTDNFTIGTPLFTQTFNSINGLLSHIYYDVNSVPYDIYSQTWDSENNYVNYANRHITYPGTTGGYEDFEYYESDYNSNGYNVRDSIVKDFSQNDPSLSNNMSMVAWLSIDDADRPYFQEVHVSTPTYTEVDSMWRYYTDPTGLSPRRDSLVYKATFLPENNDSTVFHIIDYAYNDEGLLDSMHTSYTGVPSTLQTYIYNESGLITEVFDFVDDNGIWVKTTKQEKTYEGDILVTDATLNWDEDTNQYSELQKVDCTLNSMNMWDTIRYYNNTVLTTMIATTFNISNNITEKTQYTYGQNGTVVSTFQTNYFYELLEPDGIESAWGNLEIVLYPNPTGNHLYLKMEAAGLEDNYVITIVDMNGRMINRQNLTSSNTTIATGDLAPGVYLLHVQNKDGSSYYTNKFVKY